MTFVVPAIIGLLLLAGLLTFGLGHKGWNWGTVAAAMLVLLASCGFIYLAAGVAERERVWTRLVRQLEADLLRVRDATKLNPTGRPQPIAGEKSIATLTEEQTRWRRVLERVDTWRSRAWQGASFKPPTDEARGTITLPEQDVEPPVADAEPAADAAPPGAGPAPPLGPGAEVAVFDDAPLEEGGRFLGIFRVVATAFDPTTKRTSLEIMPAVPPDEADRRLWEGRTYEPVTVYDDLPVDRWAAFHRTGDPMAAGSGVLPDPTKSDHQLLEKLERQSAELARHGTAVEGDPRELAAASPPGRYWAVVEFQQPYDLPEAVLARIAALLAPDIEGDERIHKTFAAGERAEFELQAALDLGDAVKIVTIVDRRPLADAFTGLLGGSVPGGAAGDVPTTGLAALRRGLQTEIGGLVEATRRLTAATGHVEGRQAAVDAERTDLQDDLRHWRTDVSAAESTAAALEKRLQAVAGELATTVREIGVLGREYAAGMGRLTAEIDRRAPPPVRGGGLPAVRPR